MSLPKLQINEKLRTVLLLLLLMAAVGFIVWTENQYQANFIQTFSVVALFT